MPSISPTNSHDTFPTFPDASAVGVLESNGVKRRVTIDDATGRLGGSYLVHQVAVPR